MQGHSSLGGFGLSAYFWAPALWERSSVQMESLREGAFSYSVHFVYPMQLLYSPWGYGVSVAGPGDGMSFMLGPVHLVLAAASLILAFRKGGIRTIPGRFALAGTLVICWLVEKTVGFRISLESEMAGLDRSIHGEQGYGYMQEY